MRREKMMEKGSLGGGEKQSPNPSSEGTFWSTRFKFIFNIDLDKYRHNDRPNPNNGKTFLSQLVLP